MKIEATGDLKLNDSPGRTVITRIRSKVHEFTVQVVVQGDYSCRESQNSKDSHILTGTNWKFMGISLSLMTQIFGTK